MNASALRCKFDSSSLLTRRVSSRHGRTSVMTRASRESWDFGRFVKTILFFNPPPSVSQVVERIFKQPEMETISPIQTQAEPSIPKNSVFIFGHETEIGNCLVEQMETRAVPVYTMDKDFSLSTLQSAASIVVCGSSSSFWSKLEKDVFNPVGGVSDVVWGPLDDVVMGGCSQSNLTIQPDRGDQSPFAAVFSGNITSANNGGFASVRTKNFDPSLDLTGYDGIKLKVKGDGQRYKFMLRTTSDWDSVSFCKSFDTGESWQEVKLPFSEFAPVFRAKTVRPSPPLDIHNIKSLQIMLSKFEYDGELNPSVRMGRFELPIESMKAYSDPSKLSRIVFINGDAKEDLDLKSSGVDYKSITVDKSQETPIKDSTLVRFCMESILNPNIKPGTYKETSRSSVEADTTLEELLVNFEN